MSMKHLTNKTPRILQELMTQQDNSVKILTNLKHIHFHFKFILEMF